MQATLLGLNRISTVVKLFKYIYIRTLNITGSTLQGIRRRKFSENKKDRYKHTKV